MLSPILALYVVFRVMTLPRDPMHAQGFGHDAAYLAIVAQNLHAGKGFILDARWLACLPPARLPMPYHNANPLFPAMTAGAMGLFGLDAISAGFPISALGALFPPVWALSWTAVTDEMGLMFVAAFLAAPVRSDKLAVAARESKPRLALEGSDTATGDRTWSAISPKPREPGSSP